MGRESRRNRDRVREQGSHQARLPSPGSARPGNMSSQPRVDGPPGLPPLSERIVALLAPYRNEATTLHDYQVLCDMAVLAWHLSSLPETEREREVIRAITDGIPDPGMFRDIVADLIQRKVSLFPEDTRLIAAHEAMATPHGFRVVVASARLT